MCESRKHAKGANECETKVGNQNAKLARLRALNQDGDDVFTKVCVLEPPGAGNVVLMKQKDCKNGSGEHVQQTHYHIRMCNLNPK